MSGDKSHRAAETSIPEVAPTGTAVGLTSQDRYGNQHLSAGLGAATISDWVGWVNEIVDASNQNPDAYTSAPTPLTLAEGTRTVDASEPAIRTILAQRRAEVELSRTQLDAKRDSGEVASGDYLVQMTTLDVSAKGLDADLENLTADTAEEIGHRNKAAPTSGLATSVGGGKAGINRSTTGTDGSSTTTGGGINLEQPGVYGTTSRTDALGTTTSGSAGIGLVTTADGATGVQTSSAVAVKNKDGSGTALSGDVTVTDRGVSSSSSLTNTSKQNVGENVTSQGFSKVSASGGLQVHVVPGMADGQPTYTLTAVLSGSGGVTVGGSLSDRPREPGAKASASGNVGGSGSLTYTHRLTEAELSRYGETLSDIEAGAPHNETPEFSLLSSMSALLANPGDAGVAAASLVSSDAAASLGEGDSITLALSGTAGGSLGGTAHGMGAAVAGSAATSRTVTISRSKDRHGAESVQITVAFAGTSQGSASISAGIHDAAATAATASSDSGSHTEVVTLDPTAPDYDALFHQITRAPTEGALRTAVAPLTFAQRGASTTTTASSSTDTVGMEFEALRAESWATGSGSETVTVDGGETRVEGSASGGHGGRMSWKGQEAVGESETGVIQTNVEHGGIAELNFGIQERSTDLAAGPSGETNFIRDGLTASILTAITETKTTLLQYNLSHSEINALILRAHDEAGWTRASEGFAPQHHLAPWLRLREHLISPPLPEDFPEASIEFQLQLGRMRAFNSYIQTAGPEGVAMLSNVLRHWQEDALNPHTGAEDYGLMIEFPAELSISKSDFYALREEIEDIVGPLDGTLCLSGRPDELIGLIARLTTVRASIASCTTFTNPRAQLEMLDTITRMSEKLHAVMLLEGGLDVSDASGDINMELHAREIARLEEQMHTFKTTESALFAQYAGVRAQAPAIGTYEGTLVEEGGHVLSGIRDLHEFWIDQIRDLRTAYQRGENMAMMLDAECNADVVFPWIVSTQGGSRSLDTEPDGARYVDLLVSWRFGDKQLKSADQELLNRYQTY